MVGMCFFIQRLTQIYPAETLVQWIATRHQPDVMAGKVMVLFIDNQAAMVALTSGSSRAADAAWLSHVTHLLWFQLGIRVWVEWVDSESNPADGLSREGLGDPWTQAQAVRLRWDLEEVSPPPVASIQEEARTLLKSLSGR